MIRNITHKIGLIGVGNMGLSIIQGALRSKVFTSKDFLAYARNTTRRTLVKDLTNIDFATSLQEITGCEQIVIATKPQDIAEVLSQLEMYITTDSLIVSIAAGVTLNSIKQHLNGKGHIIRVMPNIPVAVCQGVSALAIGENCPAKDIAAVQKLFSALGTTLIVKEELFNAIAALSGSGPAYLFYFMEALMEAAIKEGLEKKAACELVIGTCKGAIQLLESSPHSISLLRQMVTSPQGSTAKAIAVFEEKHFFEMIHQAVKVAISRNREMEKF